MSDSPLPDDALAHSARLQALIREQIAAAGGAIPFWRFMELALYAPGLGYYSAGATKFGAAGDFVTAPELGPLFAECVALALAPSLRALGRQARFLEVGAGSGRFAGDVIAQLRELDAMPARYAILEPSADLRDRQQAHLQAILPAADFARVEWLQGPMPDDWNGVLFANEVLDALPTPRFAIQGGEVSEEHVMIDGDGSASSSGLDALLTAAVCATSRASSTARSPTATAPNCSAPAAILVAGGRRPEMGATAVRRLRPSAARVLRSAPPRRHPARLPPPLPGRGRARRAGLQDITAWSISPHWPKPVPGLASISPATAPRPAS